jgi:hypothetical protein
MQCFDGVAKTPISCVVAGSRVLSVPFVRFRSLDTTTPCISKFLFSHPERQDGLFASPSCFAGTNNTLKENPVEQRKNGNAFVLGFFIFLGLSVLGYLLGSSAIKFKEYERSVTAKGLSEREYPADIVIWPIQFTEASNELQGLYGSLENSTADIRKFLAGRGIDQAEITVSPPSITDKSAQQYGNTQEPAFRYTALQTVTVYSGKIDLVRAAMDGLSELGKLGIVFTGGDYQFQTEYIFTRLNEIKPEMIHEATTKAREVATKFAEDSQSRLGKIKNASQGQFTIEPRDRNNPHIKKIRVVSTVEYYLAD